MILTLISDARIKMASRKRHREDGGDGLELGEESSLEDGMPPVTKKPFSGEVPAGLISERTSPG